MEEIADITIVGGGPTGLFAAFYAGMRGMRPRIVDSLPELGGQLTALYPEKYIYDVGGFPKILARDLAASLIEQAGRFEPEVILDSEVHAISPNEDHLLLETRTGTMRTRTLVVAGGKGAFEPKPLRCPGYQELFGRGVGAAVRDPEVFRDRRVVVVGGGDSALDWVLILKDLVAELVLVHRRDGFRAHAATVAQLEAAVASGEVKFLPFHEVGEIHGSDRVERVTLFDNRTEERRTHACDEVLTFLGFKPDLGPVKSWGLELQGNRILVNQLMETSVPGVYAAGDIVSYQGKLDLIATGFAEAAIAVNNAVHHVDPTARVNPGHSTNMKVFGDA